MAEREPPASLPQEHVTAPLPLPAHLQSEDGEAITVWKNETGLHIQVETPQETLRIALAKDGPHVVFEYGTHNTLPLQTPEALPAPETQPQKITLEGNLGRDPSISRDKETNALRFRVPFGVHPQKGITRWYELLAQEEAAEALAKRNLVKGQKLVVAVEDHTHTEEKKGGGTKTVYEAHVLTPDDIQDVGRKPRP
jgi:hypothetical protein